MSQPVSTPTPADTLLIPAVDPAATVGVFFTVAQLRDAMSPIGFMTPGDEMNAAAAAAAQTTANAAIPTATLGQALGPIQADATNKVPLANLPASVIGSSHFLGTWNAATNTPTIVSGTAPAGAAPAGGYYIVSLAGTPTIDGVAVWNPGDWIIWDGSHWDKITVQANPVTSVVGQLGAVSAAQISTALSLGAGALMNVGTGLSSSAGNINVVYGTAVGTSLQGTLLGAASGVAPLNASSRLATSYLQTNVASGVPALDNLGNFSGQAVGANLTATATVANLEGYSSVSLVNNQTMDITCLSVQGDYGHGTFHWNSTSVQQAAYGLVHCPLDRQLMLASYSIGIGTGSSQTVSGVLSNSGTNITGIIPGSVLITDGTNIITDDTSGNLVLAGVPVGQVFYSTSYNAGSYSGNISTGGTYTITSTLVDNASITATCQYANPANTGRWFRQFYGDVDTLYVGQGAHNLAGSSASGVLQAANNYATNNSLGVRISMLPAWQPPGSEANHGFIYGTYTVNLTARHVYGAGSFNGTQILFNSISTVDLYPMFVINAIYDGQVIEDIFVQINAINNPYCNKTRQVMASDGTINQALIGDLSVYNNVAYYSAFAAGPVGFSFNGSPTHPILRNLQTQNGKFGIVYDNQSGHTQVLNCNFSGGIAGSYVKNNFESYQIVQGNSVGQICGFLLNDSGSPTTNNGGLGGGTSISGIDFPFAPLAFLQVSTLSPTVLNTAASSGATTIYTSSTAGVAVGDFVYGRGMPAGGKVNSFVTNTSVTLNLEITANLATGGSFQSVYNGGVGGVYTTTFDTCGFEGLGEGAFRLLPYASFGGTFINCNPPGYSGSHYQGGFLLPTGGATFTGLLCSTITVSNVSSNAITAGETVAGLSPPTTILAQKSGTTGGAGTYYISGSNLTGTATGISGGPTFTQASLAAGATLYVSGFSGPLMSGGSTIVGLSPPTYIGNAGAAVGGSTATGGNGYYGLVQNSGYTLPTGTPTGTSGFTMSLNSSRYWIWCGNICDFRWESYGVGTWSNVNGNNAGNSTGVIIAQTVGPSLSGGQSYRNPVAYPLRPQDWSFFNSQYTWVDSSGNAQPFGYQPSSFYPNFLNSQTQLGELTKNVLTYGNDILPKKNLLTNPEIATNWTSAISGNLVTTNSYSNIAALSAIQMPIDMQLDLQGNANPIVTQLMSGAGSYYAGAIGVASAPLTLSPYEIIGVSYWSYSPPGGGGSFQILNSSNQSLYGIGYSSNGSSGWVKTEYYGKSFSALGEANNLSSIQITGTTGPSQVAYICGLMAFTGEIGPYNALNYPAASAGLAIGTPSSYAVLNIDNNNNLTVTSPIIDAGTKTFTPVTGATVTIPQNSGTVVINPTATLGSLTIVFPATPTANVASTLPLKLIFTQSIGAVTFTAGAGTSLGGVALPSALSGANVMHFTFIKSLGCWFYG